jgi:hypothetical protein
MFCQMDNKELEQRLTRLEQQLASLEARYLAHMRLVHGTRMAELEAKVNDLEGRVADMDKIEQLAQDAYLQTHPDALKAMLAADGVICLGLGDPQFQNIPSVKDNRPKS